MDVEQRRLGLFSTPVFELNATLSGSYVAPTVQDLPKLGPNAKLMWGAPVLTVGVGDTRGIAGAPIASLAGTPLEILGGSDLAEFNTGFHGINSTIQLDGSAMTLPFSVSLRLTGTCAFGFVPVGKVSTAELTGNWPHPSFGGDSLPRTRSVQSNGFNAEWATTAPASTGSKKQQGFQVRLIDPVDVY
jgi:inner membrane protein